MNDGQARVRMWCSETGAQQHGQEKAEQGGGGKDHEISKRIGLKQAHIGIAAAIMAADHTVGALAQNKSGPEAKNHPAQGLGR